MEYLDCRLVASLDDPLEAQIGRPRTEPGTPTEVAFQSATWATVHVSDKPPKTRTLHVIQGLYSKRAYYNEPYNRLAVSLNVGVFVVGVLVEKSLLILFWDLF